MSERPHVESISLRDILALLRSGERLVICVESKNHSQQLFRAVLRSLPGGKRTLVLSATSLQPQGKKPIPTSLNPFQAQSFAQLLKWLQQRATDVGKNGVVVIDVSAGEATWHGHEHRNEFVRRVSALLTRLRLRAIWFLPSGHLSADALASLKDDAEYFLQITESASGMHAQFLAAKRQYQPEFFLPRPVRITRDEVYFEFIPSRSSDTDDGHYSSILEAIPHPVAVFLRQKMVVTNIAFRACFFGGADVRSTALTLMSILGKKNAPLVKELQSVVEGETEHTTVFKCDVQIRTPDGKDLEFELSALPVPYAAAVGLLCIFVDISGRNKLARGIGESELWYRHIVEHSSEAISVVHDGRFVSVNRSFLTLFGYQSVEDVVGKEISRIASVKDKKAVIEKSKGPGIADGVVAVYEFQGLRMDGAAITLETQATSLVLGDRTMTLNFYHDVSARKSAAEEFLQKTRSLEILRDISISVGRHLEREAIIHESLSACMKELKFECGAVYALENDVTSLRMVRHEGLAENIVQTLEHQNVTEGVTGYVSKTAEPLILLIADYPAFLPYGSLFATHNMQTVVYVPVMTKGAVSMIMLLASTKKRTVVQQERMLFASLSTHIGMAIEHASLYEEIRESEERYRSLVENSSDVLYRISPEGGFLFAGRSIGRLLGHEAEDFYRSTELWKSLMHPEDWPVYNRALKEGHDVHLEYRMQPKGKASYRWIRDNVRFTRDSHGVTQYITGIFNDITGRRQVEDVLVRSEHLKSSILDSIQEGIVVYDTNLICVDWNRAMQSITGAARDSVVGRHASEILPKSMTDTMLPLLNEALAGKPASSEDIAVMPGKAEGQGFLWARYSPLRDREGTLRGVVGMVTDVTNRKKLEREVRESEETLRNVIESMGDALIISDLEGRIWDVNKDFTRITGYTRGEILGTSFPYPWIPDDELPRFATWIDLLREKNHLRDFDMSWRTNKGLRVAISLNTTLLRNAPGEPVAMVNIARDISDRKRLLLELERKNRQIELLNRIISKANATMDFNEIFETIAHEISALTRFDEINVSLLTDDKRAVTTYACRGPDGNILPAHDPTPLDGTPAEQAIIGQKAVVLGGLAVPHDPASHLAAAPHGFRSHISIPIYLNKALLGTLNLSSAVENAYSGNELEFLQPIAEQIGAIIDRVRLYAEVREQAQRTAWLYELGKALSGTLDLKTILNTVYSGVSKAIPVDLFSYGTFSKHSQVFVPVFEVSEGKQHYHAQGLKGKSLVLTPDSVLWDVAAHGRSYVGDAAAPFSERGSLMIVAARSKKEVIGFLSLVNFTPRCYSDIHLRLLESIATLTEIAVDKATLYEEAIEKSAEIQQRNKELDDFTYVVSHDLKEPLISVEGYSKILLEDYNERIGKEGAEYLSSIIQSGARMKSLINDLLTLSRVGRSPEQLSLVSCSDMIREILHDLQFILNEKNVSVEIPDHLPDVRYNSTHLHMVIANLISNAVKFNNKPNPRIILRVAEEEDRYVFSVSDNGIGIDERYFDKIFIIFQRLERTEEVPGTGAGLSIVKKIVEAHNGRVWVDSKLGEGTTMNFSIPK